MSEIQEIIATEGGKKPLQVDGQFYMGQVVTVDLPKCNIFKTENTSTIQKQRASLMDSVSALNDIIDKNDNIQNLLSDNHVFIKVPLTIDNIINSFESVSKLYSGYKLKVVDSRILQVDNSYVQSVSRKIAGQGRKIIMEYIDHLYDETCRIMNDYKNTNNTEAIINLLFMMPPFINGFDIIKYPYSYYEYDVKKLEEQQIKFKDLYFSTIKQYIDKK
jgi:hypothetical protein